MNDEQMARELVRIVLGAHEATMDHYQQKLFAEKVGLAKALLAKARLAALEEVYKLLCEHCRIAAPRTIESDERGTYYWHDFGNLSMECQASKVRQAVGEGPRIPRCLERNEETGQCELRKGHEGKHLAGYLMWAAAAQPGDRADEGER